MTIQTATYRNIRFTDTTNPRIRWTNLPVDRVDTFSNTFRYRAEDGKTARLAPVAVKSLNDLTRKDA